MGALFPSNPPDLPLFPRKPLPGHHKAVSPEEMLRQLERLARRMGLAVRFEAFDPHASRRGGLCTLRGTPLVLVDAHATTIDQVGVMCEALAHFDVEVMYIPPLLRARIQRFP